MSLSKDCQKIITEYILSQYEKSTYIPFLWCLESDNNDFCQVDAYLKLDGSELPQIDRYFCYIVFDKNGYHCDCKYILTIYMEKEK